MKHYLGKNMNSMFHVKKKKRKILKPCLKKYINEES